MVENQAEGLDIRMMLRKFISDTFILADEVENYSDEDSFLEHRIIDSTVVLEMIMFIEETFGFQIEDEEVIPDNLDSVNKTIVFIE
ncbi:acyl carrier protein [Chloroflexota bacterium]